MTKFLALIALAFASVGALTAASSSDYETCPEPTATTYVPCYPTTTTPTTSTPGPTTTVPQTTSTTAPAPTTTSTSQPESVDLPDCSELPANLTPQDPEFRPELDGDGDGIACEAPPVAPPAVPVIAQPTFSG